MIVLNIWNESYIHSISQVYYCVTIHTVNHQLKEVFIEANIAFFLFPVWKSINSFSHWDCLNVDTRWIFVSFFQTVNLTTSFYSEEHIYFCYWYLEQTYGLKPLQYCIYLQFFCNNLIAYFFFILIFSEAKG